MSQQIRPRPKNNDRSTVVFESAIGLPALTASFATLNWTLSRVVSPRTTFALHSSCSKINLLRKPVSLIFAGIDAMSASDNLPSCLPVIRKIYMWHFFGCINNDFYRLVDIKRTRKKST